MRAERRLAAAAACATWVWAGLVAAVETASVEAQLPLEPESTEGELPLEPELPIEAEVPVDSEEAPRAPPDEAEGELFGYFAFETRFFPRSPLGPTAPRYHNASLAFEPGYHLDFGAVSLRAVAFVRLDEHDLERSHFDAREAALQVSASRLLITLGIARVFWGVTESRHLVDVVNQTDYLEDVDGEDKLGQLLASVSYQTAHWGLLEGIVTSGFRLQRFPGAAGRPGVTLLVRQDEVRFDASWRRWNPDLALRWSHALGPLDLAVSYFRGTSREPQLDPSPESLAAAAPVVVPRYDLIHQAGLELQLTTGGWLCKLEALGRAGQGPSFAAVTAGFEYTLYGLLGGGRDLGLLVEYSHDGRDNFTFNVFDDDVFAGARISFNDEGSSQVLVGALVDVSAGTTLARAEASHRFGQHWKLAVEARGFFTDDESDPAYFFRRDHYGEATLAYYF